MKHFEWRVAALAAGLIGCGGGLSGAGAQVDVLRTGSPPAECDLLGDVSIGVPPNTARPGSESEAITLMRNEAGADGAEYVVLVGTRERSDGGERYFEARGRAYDCPEDG